ncbi:MAG: acylphosphatase [Bacteroidia bacterium]|nr:acylphosphatase [Bacteroidia bacterium]
MEKQVEIIVEGKVQGVYFRKSTKEIAQLLDITGFVKNESNGNVLIQASGTATQIDQFITWCKTGPPAAGVTNVTTQDKELEAFNSFEIQK